MLVIVGAAAEGEDTNAEVAAEPLGHCALFDDVGGVIGVAGRAPGIARSFDSLEVSDSLLLFFVLVIDDDDLGTSRLLHHHGLLHHDGLLHDGLHDGLLVLHG